MPELAGFVLLFTTVALGVSWALDQNRSANARRTTGRIIEVIGSDAAAPRVMFTYTVNGTLYSNSTEPDFAGRTLASLLPVAIMAKLGQHGIFQLDDLPEEVRRQIREGTDHSFDELNDADRQALQTHGYQNADQLRLALRDAMDGQAPAGTTQTSAQRLKVDVSVPVLYDPDNPANSTIAQPGGSPQQATLSSLVPFLTAALLTCTYFGAAYPRWKRRQP